MAEFARYHDPTRGQLFAEMNRLRSLANSYTGDRALADRTVSMATTWPGMDPSVAYALAQAGIDPGSETAAQVARTSQTVNARKGRGAFSPLGDVVTAGSGFVGDRGTEIGALLGTTVRGTVRGGLTLAAAPFEEAQGLLRSTAGTIGGRPGGAAVGALGGAAIGSIVPGVGTAIGAAVGGGIGAVAGFLAGDKIESADPGFRSQSTLGQAVGQLIEKGEADLGSGYLPGGTAAAEQERRAIEAASIEGKGLTIGRLTTTAVFEPGSRPYDIVSGLIDATAVMKLDPAVKAGMKHSQIRAARRTILSEKADDFITSVPGQQLMQGLADEKNAFRIWQMSKEQFPVEVAVRIANARTAHDVAQVIRPELGFTVTQKFKPVVKRTIDKPRLLTDMPIESMEWDRPAEFIKKADQLMKLAKVLPEDRLDHADELMRVLASNDRGARQPAVKALQDMLADTVHHLSENKAGVARLSKPEAKRLVSLFGDEHESLRNYTAAEIAEDRRIPGLLIDGKGHKIPAPSLISELMHASVPVPSVGDLRQVRREISEFWGPLMHTPGLGMSLGAAETGLSFLKSRIWKPMVLGRAALTVRVIGEEQVRMAGAGLDSFFNHPLSYISRVVATEAKVSPVTMKEPGVLKRGLAATGRAAEDLGFDVGRGRTGFVDELADSVAGQDALTKARGADAIFATEGRLVPTGRKTMYRSGEEGFDVAWLDHELGHLQADPVAQHLVKHGAEATKDWLWNGAGRKFVNEFRRNRPDSKTFMRNKADVDLYVDGVVGKRVKEFTQDDDELLGYIARGRRTKGSAKDMTPDEVAARKVAQRRIGELVDEGRVPEAAVGDDLIPARKGGMEYHDQATNWLFSNLLSKPTNTLNRSRVFEQTYWLKAEDMMTALSPSAQRQAMTAARKAKLSKEQIARLDTRMAQGSGKLSLKQADVALKAQALDRVQELLYELTKRGNWADATRLVFPFAEPWKEMLTTWAKLAYERPQIARRAQLVVEGARGNGMFYIDPQTGEEMFAFPGSEFITKMVTGAPVKMHARVAGLNLFADNPILPGFGPLVQIAAGAIIPDKPQFDWLQDTINPFGVDDEGTLEKIGFPAAWMDKARAVFASPDSDRLFANTVYDMSRYLVSRGEADISTEDGQLETTKKATQMARKLYMLRTLASFTAPSAPQMQFLSGIENPEDAGRLIAQFKLVETFREYQDEDYDGAVDRFLGDFGEEALMFMQPKTRGGAPAEEEMLQFARRNPELTEKYPEVWHFFGPKGGDFSYAAYVRQINAGQREALGGKGLSLRDLQRMANNRVAGMRYRKAREMVGDSPNRLQRQWLDQVKTALLDKYPGFEPEPRDIGKSARQIRELEAAARDRKLGRTDVGQALSMYFDLRGQAAQAARDQGVARDHTQARGAQHLRQWLRGAAQQISDKVDGFAPVFDQVLSREMAEDDPIEANPVLPVAEEEAA